VGIYLTVMAAISLIAQLALHEIGSSPLDAVGRDDDPLRSADGGVQWPGARVSLSFASWAIVVDAVWIMALLTSVL
jgi:hypothetical protein